MDKTLLYTPIAIQGDVIEYDNRYVQHTLFVRLYENDILGSFQKNSLTKITITSLLLA